MGLFGRSEPVRPKTSLDPGYNEWWLYWFTKFEDEKRKEPPKLPDGVTFESWRYSIEFWSEWRKYKQEKWYETRK